MFTHVVLAVDLACFTLSAGLLKLLVVRRAAEPFADVWALPGGAVQADESLDSAATRLLAERTGLAPSYLEQLYTFGDPRRDPRGRTVSVAYYAVLPGEPTPRAGREVAAVAWQPIDQLPSLAFDHARIAAYARWRLDQKLTYTPLAFRLLPATFTLGDLRTIHEAVGGQPLNPSNFTRQMLARWDLAPLPGVRDRRTRRPARLYQYIGDREIAGPPGSERGDWPDLPTRDHGEVPLPPEGAI